MLKRLLAIMIAAGFIVAGEVPAAIAQKPAKAHAVPTASALAQFQAQIRDEVARMTSLSPKEIEVQATNAVIRVVLVNTGYNEDRPSEREYLASAIAALVRTNAEKDLAYKDIVVLHVEFVKRDHWFTKWIDRVEYRRGPDGAFSRHRT
jgi:hypothetical protein